MLAENLRVLNPEISLAPAIDTRAMLMRDFERSDAIDAMPDSWRRAVRKESARKATLMRTQKGKGGKKNKVGVASAPDPALDEEDDDNNDGDDAKTRPATKPKKSGCVLQ
jgi:hypothetical protein